MVTNNSENGGVAGSWLALKEVHMAAPGGPDEETWKRMTPAEKAIYWIFVALVAGATFGLLLFDILK